MKTVGLFSPFHSPNSTTTTKLVLARMHLSSFCLSLSLSGVSLMEWVAKLTPLQAEAASCSALTDDSY